MHSTSNSGRLGVFACCLLLQSVGLASDDDEVVEGPVGRPSQQQAALRVPQMADFDQQFFQGAGNASSAEQHLRSQIRLQIVELDRICQLDDAQKAKLELAARGDLRRFLEPVDVLRQKFNAARQDQNALNAIWQELHNLQAKMFRGLTGPGSLLTKTIPQTLTSEQTSKYDAVVSQRQVFRYRASIGVALHNVEATVALTHEQRERLTRLLLDLPPPHTFGQYDHYLVLYRLANLPAEKIQPLLDERQWEAMKKHLDRYRGLRSFLIEQGLLSREDVGEVVLANPRREDQP
jgi:hypothetical protein